jgi:hypothetical protein
MTLHKLTRQRTSATCFAKEGRMGKSMRTGLVGMTMMGATLLGGCINIAAPDEPIVIELNINIRQEVIYRLAEDAASTIDENADIF